MSNPAPKIPTHLRPDLSEDMSRTEMWLSKCVSPINGHKLITQEQADHLLSYREHLLADTTTPRDRWNKLHAHASDYLAQLPEQQRQQQIVDELNTTIQPDKSFNTNLFLTAAEFGQLHRRGHFRNSVRVEDGAPQPIVHTTRVRPEKPAQRAEPKRQHGIRIDGEALDQTWHNFASAYRISAAQAGAAARKLRSDEPFAPNSVNQQRFLLRKQGQLAPFFQYIYHQPDAFFGALEAQIGKPINAEDRQPLLDQLAAAFAATGKGQGR